MSLCNEDKVLIFTFFGAPYLARSGSPDLSEPSASNRDRKGLNNRAEHSRPVAKTGASATELPVDRPRLKTRNGDPASSGNIPLVNANEPLSVRWRCATAPPGAPPPCIA